jgi:hypothetical protein
MYMESIIRRYFIGEKPNALLKHCLYSLGLVIPDSDTDSDDFDDFVYGPGPGSGSGSDFESDTETEQFHQNAPPMYSGPSGPSDFDRVSNQRSGISFTPGLSEYQQKVQRSAALKDTISRDTVVAHYTPALKSLGVVEDQDTLVNAAYELFRQLPPMAGGGVRNGCIVMSLFYSLPAHFELFQVTSAFKTLKTINTTKAQQLFKLTFPRYTRPEALFTFCGIEISNYQKGLIRMCISALKERGMPVDQPTRAAVMYVVLFQTGSRTTQSEIQKRCGVNDGTFRNRLVSIQAFISSILKQPVPNIYQT